MRKMYNTAADTRPSDCVEFTRRLHKNITDIARRLDKQRSQALTVIDIFIPSGETLRVKLKDYCERLIFKDPIEHGRKTEELLWRKGFYDIVYAAKKLRKGNTWSETEKALLSAHLAVGVGFYYHLILRLQLEYSLDLVGVFDFTFTQNDIGLLLSKTKTSQSKIYTEELKQCVMRLIHRSIVCLGDLARYKLELEPNWDPMIANRYYKIAISINPNIGMPHNQLGTIAGSKNYGLDAVYHYMRCVLCSEPFEGAEGNLKRSIITHFTCSDEKNVVHQCISRLFSLLHLWDYEMPNSDRINQECQGLLNDIENCLTMEQFDSKNPKYIGNESSIDAYLEGCKSTQVSYLTDDMVFKVVAVCLMSISRLKSRESSEVQGVVAITLAIFSQLVQFTITKLQELVIDMTLSHKEEIPNITKLEISQSMEMDNKQNKLVKSTTEEHMEKDEQETESVSNVDNDLVNSNDNKVSNNEMENVENNGNGCNNFKKSRDKTRNLLTKLRRRKRKDSSDSEGSDVHQTNLGSSSDERNSDISEMEDDVLSEENALSDDALSDDVTDEEGIPKDIKIEITTSTSNEEINGDTNIIIDKSADTNSEEITHLKNGNFISIGSEDLTVNDKNSITNSESTTTVTTNVDSSSVFDESSGSTNTVTYVTQLKKQNLKPLDNLNILEGQEVLATIKICCDWLKSNQDIIRICARSTKMLLKRITILLNLINIDIDALLQNWEEDAIIFSNAEKLKKSVQIVPLPEDMDLRGLNILEDAQKHLNWKILHKYKMSKQVETLLRALKMVEFGHYLSSIPDSGVKYDEIKKLFVVTEMNASAIPKGEKIDNKDLEAEHPRGKLMRHMGRLWLKAEVCALESRLRSRLMSPYLVPDHEVLAKHTSALKRLVYAKRFIVVIPTVVVSALDEVKRISGRAREATRWLEAQLRRGSRFLRAQRPHERLALPLIKGPRPKDKEAWLFFQIIECCHYLTQQAKVGLTGDTEAPVVTLLTGCNPDDEKTLTFSPDGLAKSAGINLEYIESFHMKWKASSKSHG